MVGGKVGFEISCLIKSIHRMILHLTMRFDFGFAHHCTLVNTHTDTGMQTDSFNQLS